jgi:hypothetical protein
MNLVNVPGTGALNLSDQVRLTYGTPPKYLAYLQASLSGGRRGRRLRDALDLNLG